MTHPNRIAQLREELGKTGVHLAKKLNRSVSYIHNIETGKRGLKFSVARIVAEDFGCEMEDLVDGPAADLDLENMDYNTVRWLAERLGVPMAKLIELNERAASQ